MGYKPDDFFVGIIDFFGILVPGAVLLFLHPGLLTRTVGLRPDLPSPAGWAGFLVGSYVLGHFLLGVGVPLNHLLRFFKPESKDEYYNGVKQSIKLPSKAANDRHDVFYRAYAFVRISNSPSALGEIERQMADYKLFRSLTLVFALDVVWVMFRHAEGTYRLTFSAILFVLAAWRFLWLIGWTYRITFEYYEILCNLPSVALQSDEKGPPK